MLVARSQSKGSRVLVSSTVGPDYRQVLRTYNTGLGLDIVEIPHRDGETDWAQMENRISKETICVIIQSPNYLGVFEDYRPLVESAHEAGAMVIHVFHPLALSLYLTPGEMGADIAVGDGQCLGNPLNYGGPGFGIFTTRREFIRKVPGRIVGQTQDLDGQRGYVLTLQTREQHIRREKATSNICTNQALCALLATIHLGLIGRQGFVELGEKLASRAAYFIDQLNSIDGAEAAWSKPGFNEVAVRLKKPVNDVLKHLKSKKILGGIELERYYPELKDMLLVSFTEHHTRADIDALLNALKEVV
jgi:glycine dehydrogenase subunit 1